MKIEKFFTISLLILFTNFGFAQDSLSQNKNQTKKIELNVKHKGLEFNTVKVDTIFIIKNNYKLNQDEKYSIIDSIFNKNRKLYEDYIKNNNTCLLLDENIVYFHSILNHKKMSYLIKQNLLINKLNYDDKNKKKKNEVLHQGSDLLGSSSFSKLARKKTIKKIKEIRSKRKAIESYVNEIHQANINFSQALLIIDGVVVEKNTFLKTNKIKIKKIDLISEKYGPALYGSRGRNGIIIITTTTK